MARGEIHRDLGRRPPVDLGRAPGARAPTLVEAAVVDLEQALVGKAIEMVSGNAPLQPDRVGSLFAADPIAHAGDVLVEGPPVRLGQRADGAEIVSLVSGGGISIHRVSHSTF